MKTLHTPWTVGDWLMVYDNNAQEVALPYGSSRQEQEAIAHLIAAAPETAAERDRLKAVNAELRAALTVSHDAMIIASGRSNTAARAVSAAIHQARAAIAKASGQ